ncbi:MAG: LysM peptidoglycan-binding domain-containing protein, partial [Burkholderiaceae bacterium]
MGTDLNRFCRQACTLALLVLAPAGVMAADAPQTLALTIAQGDTLIGIAGRYLEQPERWRDLARLNRIRNPRRLRPGAPLQIPLDWMRWSQLAADVVHTHGAVQGNRGPLAVGMRLSQGDSVDTGADGSVTLRFSDGSLA